MVFRCVRSLRILLLLIVTGLACGALRAQTADRITQEVDPAQSIALPHHHPLWANAANDAGLVSPSLPLEHLTLVLARSPWQQLAFETFLADQQNPASPGYHHWLTPAQVGQRFGLSDADLASLTGWLQSQGLHVNWVSPSRIFIGFGGTAGDVGRAFQTEMHTYTVDGVQRMSISSDPIVPRALAPALKAIHGLYTIEDRPAHHITAVQSASPQMTITSGGQTYHFITPGDFQTIYDVPYTYNGYGQTIGILARSRTDFADFTSFSNLTSRPFQSPTEVVPTAFGGVDPGPALTAPPSGSVSTGDQSEATLDVTRAGSIADNANLLLVVASNSSGGIEVDAQYLVQTTPVPAQIMTISFGACESGAGPAGVAFWDTLFQQAAAEGISSFVSSGDSGASGCDPAFATPPFTPLANSPNYICSSSYVTCVGGTEFNDTSNPTYYWGTSGGIATAQRYIPEGGWNEPLNSNSKPQVAASGGGVSTVIPTPAWQTGTGVPAARSGRYTPDISFSASCHDGYFGCMAAEGASCVVGANGSYQFLAFCGTSAAAPSMAGVTALLDSEIGSATGVVGAAQGNLNPGIYQVAANAVSPFHDAAPSTSGVTTCSINTPSMCNNSIPSSTGLTGGQAGYPLTAGFDEVTGLGSLDVGAFLTSYYALRSTPTVNVSPSSSSITTLQAVTVTVTVSGPSGSPTPTGSVVLSVGSHNYPSTPLVAGVATFQIPAKTLPSGTYSIAANYTPDTAGASTYYPSTAWATVLVTLVAPSITQTLSSAAITTAQALIDTVVVSGGANPTPAGTVYLNGGGYGASATLNSGSAIFNIAAGLLTAGDDSLQAYYVPSTQGYDIYSNAAVSTPVAVTPTAQFTPLVTVTPSATTTVKANPLQVTITLSGGANPTPTGSVTLTTGGYSSPSSPLVGGISSITIPAETLAVGVDSLTAIYAPDAASLSTYNNTSGSAQVTVYNPAISTPVITFFPSSSTITTAQMLTMTVTVSSNAGYPITTTGSVILSGGGYASAATPLIANSATFSVPAGSLTVGTDTLTASYTPDVNSMAIFFAASSSTTITVTTPAPNTFTLTGTSISVSPGATTANPSTITVTPSGSFIGSVALTATVTSSPTGAQFPPTLSFGSTGTVSITGANPAAATLTISTTAGGAAPCSATLQQRPGIPWYGKGGAVLACFLFFVIPVRGRKGRTRLGMMLLLAVLVSGVVSCGGGGGTSCPNIVSTGTTAGTYTVTVTGTSGATTAQNTFTLTVQ
jgi:subtilase family serine protease